MVDRLTDGERALLIHCLRQHMPELLSRISELDLPLPDKELINQMRNAVGFELANKAFFGDKDSDKYGMELEALIDKLANLYLWPNLKQNLKGKIKKVDN